MSDNPELATKQADSGHYSERLYITDVFTGMGELAGKYTVHTDPKVSPAVHPPRRLPIALQDAFKSELQLDAMVEKKVIVTVTEPPHGC